MRFNSLTSPCSERFNWRPIHSIGLGSFTIEWMGTGRRVIHQSMPPAWNHHIKLNQQMKVALSVLFQFSWCENLNSHALMSFIPRKKNLNLSTHVYDLRIDFYLRITYFQLLVAFLLILPFASGQVFVRQIWNNRHCYHLSTLGK